MKPRSILALILLALPSSLLAQKSGEPVLKPVMNLSECVAYAQANSPQVLSLAPQIENLLLQEQLSKEAFLPSVNASIGEDASFGRSPGVDGVTRNVSSANTSFGINASIDLFRGMSRVFSLQKAREALKSKDYIVSDVLDNIALQTIEAYTTLLLSHQLTAAAEENLALSKKNLEETSVQVELGKLPISQKIQIQSQVGNDELTLAQAKADEERARRLLLLNMGVSDPTATIAIPQPSPDEVATQVESFEPYYRDPSWVLPATKKTALDLELSEYDIKIAKSAYWPSLSLNGGYSNGYYYNFGDGVDKAANPAFNDQWAQNGRTFVGLTLSIPIYNRGQVRGQVRQAELQQLSLRSQYIQKTYQDEQNVLLAETDLKKAEDSYRISKQNIGYTKQSLDIANLEYKAGRITAYEWEQAKNNHIQAQATYLQAVYTRLLRTINLTYYHSGRLPFHLAQ